MDERQLTSLGWPMRKVRDYRSARLVFTIKKDQDRSHYGSSLTTAKGDILTGTATGVSLDAMGMINDELRWRSNAAS